jgi:hypothetical protein
LCVLSLARYAIQVDAEDPAKTKKMRTGSRPFLEGSPKSIALKRVASLPPPSDALPVVVAVVGVLLQHPPSPSTKRRRGTLAAPRRRTWSSHVLRCELTLVVVSEVVCARL